MRNDFPRNHRRVRPAKIQSPLAKTAPPRGKSSKVRSRSHVVDDRKGGFLEAPIVVGHCRRISNCPPFHSNLGWFLLTELPNLCISLFPHVCLRRHDLLHLPFKFPPLLLPSRVGIVTGALVLFPFPCWIPLYKPIQLLTHGLQALAAESTGREE